MVRLIARKLVLIVLLLPLLNALGYFYATTYRRLLRGASTYSQLPILGGAANTGDYGAYFRGLLSGDLGKIDQTPISSILAEPVRNSLIVLGLALLVTVVFGLALGFLAISPRTKRVRPLALVFLTAGSSLPGFFLGSAALALIIYGSLLKPGRGTIFPIGGFGLDEHLILPVLTLASRPMLQVARVAGGLLENELQQDYIRVALSKGLSWRRILWQHAFPNIVAPIVITIGQSMRLLIGGLIIVEALFRWPGIGRVFMIIVGVRVDGRVPLEFFSNPELLAAIALIFGIWLLLADLITSVVAALSDPRLRQAASSSMA
ncbi:MAG: glutathione ABC transporter permease [Herpetosiphonaceae bacterium]|nr:MAG: glutathione ABC transporter permease [Herpetosiphonaceae bacterium]